MKSPKKILHVLLSEAWGGLELYTLDLISKQNNPTQVLYCKKNSKVDQEARARGIKTTYSFFWLWSQVEIIHVHRRQDLPRTRLALIGRPSVKLVYSLLMNAPPKKDPYHKWIYQRVNALMSSSEWVNENVRKNFPIDPTRVHLVRYGRNPSPTRLSKEEISHFKTQMNLPKKKLTLGTLCRIDPGKGVGEIGEALKHLSDEELKMVNILLVGDPTLLKLAENNEPIYEIESIRLFDKLTDQSKEARYKDSLHLLPFQKDPLAVLSAMDVFILASYQETYSLAVLDAMALGSPVIGTHSGGTVEQIGKNQERGRFTTAKDSQSLADAIRFYLNHSELIEAQGLNAKQWCTSTHNWEKCLTEVNLIYDNC